DDRRGHNSAAIVMPASNSARFQWTLTPDRLLRELQQAAQLQEPEATQVVQARFEVQHRSSGGCAWTGSSAADYQQGRAVDHTLSTAMEGSQHRAAPEWAGVRARGRPAAGWR